MRFGPVGGGSNTRPSESFAVHIPKLRHICKPPSLVLVAAPMEPYKGPDAVMRNTWALAGSDRETAARRCCIPVLATIGYAAGAPIQFEKDIGTAATERSPFTKKAPECTTEIHFVSVR